MTRLALLAAAVLVSLAPSAALAGPENEIDAPFFTMEDGKHYGNIQKKKDFKWLFQKPFIGGVVERALRARGFDPEVAKRIAADWDGWRYDFETGERIMPKPPMQMKAEDAIELARRIPSCLSDLAKSDCKMKFAMDFGCALGPQGLRMCQRNYAIVRETAQTFGTKPGGTLYKSLGCLEEGGKGADMVVFAPAEVQAASKMKFDAVAQANSAPVPASLPAAPPPPAPAPAAPPVAAAPTTPAPVAGAPRPTAAAPAAARPPQPLACAVLVGNTSAAKTRALKAEFGVSDSDIVQINMVDKIEETITEIRNAVRGGKPVDTWRDLTRDLGMTLQTGPKVTLALPAASGLTPRRIEDFREGWIGAHASTGLELTTLSDLIEHDNGLISAVSPNGAAARAGLQVGDKVVSFGGKTVYTSRNFVSFARDAAIGQEVELVVERAGNRQTMRVAVSALPDDAEHGDALANRVMGQLQTGVYGAAADNRRALGSFEKAATAGDSYAMLALARLHFGSATSPTEGVPRNNPLGVQWLRRAAQANNGHAAHDLARRLQNGTGVTKDLADARRMYEVAAKAGISDSMVNLANMLYRGDGGAPSPVLARQWTVRAAEAGNVVGMRNAGIMFQSGIGGGVDINAARTWLTQATAKGDRDAAEALKKLP